MLDPGALSAVDALLVAAPVGGYGWTSLGAADAYRDYASLETPDLFKHGAEVVVEDESSTDGELSSQGEPVFHASKVLAKCPSKFEAQATEQASF